MNTFQVAIIALLISVSGIAQARDNAYGGYNSGSNSRSSNPYGSTYGSPGEHSVKSHTRSDGTYVPQHQQTNPNDTRMDNWSTKGNVNPYTGKEGTVDPYKPYGR